MPARTVDNRRRRHRGGNADGGMRLERYNGAHHEYHHDHDHYDDQFGRQLRRWRQWSPREARLG